MEALKKNHNKFITLKQAKKVVIVLVVVFFFEFLLFPAPAVMADELVEVSNVSQNQTIISSVDNEADQGVAVNVMEFNGKLPESNNLETKWSTHIVITAYNSEPGQTDNTPCITANNFNVCENGVEDTVAANFLPFGTKVKIPAIFGDKVFVVRDRMNRRFSNRVDIWMTEKPDAVNFGIKIAKIEVLK